MKILYAPFARPLRNGNTNAKNFPWSKELVALLESNKHEVTQIGGEEDERVIQKFIQPMSFFHVGAVLQNYDTFIGVDSYLQHAAWFYKKRGIVIFSQSDPLIFGHDFHVNLLKSRKFLRQGYKMFDTWEGVTVRPEAFVSPAEIVTALDSLRLKGPETAR